MLSHVLSHVVLGPLSDVTHLTRSSWLSSDLLYFGCLLIGLLFISCFGYGLFIFFFCYIIISWCWSRFLGNIYIRLYYFWFLRSWCKYFFFSLYNNHNNNNSTTNNNNNNHNNNSSNSSTNSIMPYIFVSFYLSLVWLCSETQLLIRVFLEEV